MSTLTHRRAGRPTDHSTGPAPQVAAHAVCVVDPRGDDYAPWREAAGDGRLNLNLKIVATAAEALPIARTREVDAWVINTQLPGMSGFELCEMLRQQCPKALIYLVADEYSPAAEQAAFARRATMFGCKPGHLALLDSLIEAPDGNEVS